VQLTVQLFWLCVQYHPDVNKQAGAEEKFKEISNAYEVGFAQILSILETLL
jgi:hypothetical protein